MFKFVVQERIMIVDELKSRDDELAVKFFNLGERIIKDTVPHLKEITTILVDFDTHDEEHSKAVLDNMAKLIGDKIHDINTVELFLLWQGAYLHDIGMALPKFEINLLKLVEENERFDVSTKDEPKILNFEGKTYKETVKIIKDNCLTLYGNFSEIKNFIFSPNNEEDLIKYLTEEYIDYQKYRYGSYKELRITNSEEYNNRNKNVRIAYIRDTHHKRSEHYIKFLDKLFIEYLGGEWARQLVLDLGKIVQGHCEPFSYIEKLNLHAIYYKNYIVNLQFIAILLRLGDVIHFSSERALKSLFAEKMISSEISKEHWDCKNRTGLNYSILKSEENKRAEINFSGFCQNPKDYYFINDYLDTVDKELFYYDTFIRNLKYNKQLTDSKTRYNLNLPIKVSRENINFDSERFSPAPNLKFTLEQKQILQLLMGVNLYKDKNLAIRELYQNALDACRVYQLKHKNFEGIIQFGLDTQIVDGKNRKYFFCHDNGIGMTKYIIENYFVKIGKSYYKSEDFFKKNIRHDAFNPISQFGIGILSCFMIGDKFEVITKTADENEIICLFIDGPYERFYYKKPRPEDIEIVKEHGSVVKVFLNKEACEQYDDSLCENIKRNYFIEKLNLMPRVKIKKSINIYKVLLKIIKMYPSNIKVEVVLGGKNVLLQTKMELTDYSTFKQEDVDAIYKSLSRIPYSNNIPKVDVLVKNYENIEIYKCTNLFNGIELNYYICLPKKNFDDLTIELLRVNTVSKNYILVDGISVEGRISNNDVYKHLNSVIINFIDIKPQLSIDRKNITGISQDIKDIYEQIPLFLSNEILKLSHQHIAKYNLDDLCKALIWNYLSKQFPFILTNLYNITQKNLYLDFNISNIGLILKDDITIADYINQEEVIFKRSNFNYFSFGAVQKYLFLGKVINADSITLDKDYIHVISKIFNDDFKSEFYRYDNWEDVVICCDNWSNDFKDYDLVTSLFPFLPNTLFNKIKKESRFENSQLFTSRAKLLHHNSNTLIGVAYTQAPLIDKKLGISIKEPHTNFENKKSSLIHSFYQFQKNIWFPEFWGDSFKDLPKNTKKDVVFYMFVSPCVLSNDEKSQLELYTNTEPEYVKGVKKGWSVLFWGDSHEMTIEPGKVKRSEMLKKRPANVRINYNDYEFRCLDGTLVEE